MVIKSSTKTAAAKKVVKPAATSRPKKVVAPVSEAANIQKMIELHTQHLTKLDAMISSLQKDVSEIRSIVAQEKATASKGKAKPVASPVKAAVTTTQTSVKSAKTPVSKPTAAKTTKTSVAKKPVKKAAAVSAVVKAPVKAVAKPVTKTPVKSVKKSSSKVISEVPVSIPSSIADRINALTAKKVVNQTQLGADADLPQNIIHEISTRKLKRISAVSIEKIAAALKKYETK